MSEIMTHAYTRLPQPKLAPQHWLYPPKNMGILSNPSFAMS